MERETVSKIRFTGSPAKYQEAVSFLYSDEEVAGIVVALANLIAQCPTKDIDAGGKQFLDALVGALAKTIAGLPDSVSNRCQTILESFGLETEMQKYSTEMH